MRRGSFRRLVLTLALIPALVGGGAGALIEGGTLELSAPAPPGWFGGTGVPSPTVSDLVQRPVLVYWRYRLALTVFLLGGRELLPCAGPDDDLARGGPC